MRSEAPELAQDLEPQLEAMRAHPVPEDSRCLPSGPAIRAAKAFYKVAEGELIDAAI